MTQDKESKKEPGKKLADMTSKKFETFDTWSEAQFAMWSNARYDFELIAELTRHRKSVSMCLELLHSVNSYLKNAPKGVFFDGTIRCLKYLVANKYLNIDDLPLLTQDEKYLVELLKKYSKKLDITEVLSDIEEPTLRVMLIEYPHLITEVFKDNPIAENLVSKALLKHGITDGNILMQKVDDGTNSIEVDRDKNSKEAMKCKIIYIGLRLNCGLMSVSANARETINQFETLTDTVVENEEYSKSIFNSMYVAFYGIGDAWNKERKTHLTGCETLYLDFQLLSLPDNHMSKIYDYFLVEEVDKIGKKYFGDEYSPNGNIASLAIKMAITIILFRAENFIPEGEKEEVFLFTRGAMIGGLNYAVKETGNEEQPLALKDWFIEYFRDELDKRVAFIKMQIDNNVAVYRFMNRVRVLYLPVFESFRFFCKKQGTIEQIIKLLKNTTIPNNIKNEIFINFVINIQKIVAQAKLEGDESYFKDAFILLIIKTFEGLSIKNAAKLKDQSKKYYEIKDLIGDSNIAIIELILKFDLSKNDSFIAYLSHNLQLQMRTASRMKKAEFVTDTDATFEEGFIDSIPNASDLMSSLGNDADIQKIKECIEKLPQKEMEAVKKLAESNEKFNATERKAKNRGLSKVREMMNIP